MSKSHYILLSFAFPIVIASMGMAGSTPWQGTTSKQNPATLQAGQAVHKAQANVDKLQLELNKIRSRIRSQVMSKPEWADVLNGRKETATAAENARKQALQILQRKDEYKTLVKERDEAQAVIAQAAASDVDAGKAMDDFVKLSFSLKEMERSALTDDAKYQEAMAQAQASGAKMQQLDSQVGLALKDDQEYRSTEQQLEQAKTALAAARQQFAQAARQEQEARAAAARARQQSTSRR